jgi:alcohol dehydrogenase class IV
VSHAFTWRDGERLIRFGAGASAEAAGLVEQAGFAGYALLTTERALGQAPPGLADRADAVLRVPAGRVDEISAQLLGETGDRPLVGLGGGRVIDAAKAIAGARDGGRCAAVPTTLSGAPMTPFHRTPAGVEGARWVRPALVVADPELMASQPRAQLAGSAMNALAHAMESLYTPLANPVSELAALEAASLIAGALPAAEPERAELALASVLAGYAVGSTGLAIHHAVCQTIVRVAGTPHAETNAVMLPHFARLMAGRAPVQLGKLAEALGDPAGDPQAAAGLISKLAGRSAHTRLSTLGVTAEQLPEIVDGVQGHRGLDATPDPPGRDELLKLLEASL